MEALIVDLFAGGGGASAGIEAAFGSHVNLAINHSPIAISVHKANHPNTVHFTTDIWEVDPVAGVRWRAGALPARVTGLYPLQPRQGRRPQRARTSGRWPTW
jgi:site-specific DNA-cytosine methylase